MVRNQSPMTVYPVTGWWRERMKLGMVGKKARYSLVVSISTEAKDVELYTGVMNQITIETKVPTIVDIPTSRRLSFETFQARLFVDSSRYA